METCALPASDCIGRVTWINADTGAIESREIREYIQPLIDSSPKAVRQIKLYFIDGVVYGLTPSELLDELRECQNEYELVIDHVTYRATMLSGKLRHTAEVVGPERNLDLIFKRQDIFLNVNFSVKN